MTTIKPTNYTLLKKQAASLIEDEHHMIAILSNMSALLNDNLDQVNWVGFYLKEQDELILGPFKDTLLVSTFQLEKVCGTAVSERRTQVIADVHQFEGHIACDANSKSEIVVPIFKDDKIIGVLDIDAL